MSDDSGPYSELSPSFPLPFGRLGWTNLVLDAAGILGFLGKPLIGRQGRLLDLRAELLAHLYETNDHNPLRESYLVKNDPDKLLAVLAEMVELRLLVPRDNGAVDLAPGPLMMLRYLETSRRGLTYRMVGRITRRSRRRLLRELEALASGIDAQLQRDRTTWETGQVRVSFKYVDGVYSVRVTSPSHKLGSSRNLAETRGISAASSSVNHILDLLGPPPESVSSQATASDHSPVGAT